MAMGFARKPLGADDSYILL